MQSHKIDGVKMMKRMAWISMIFLSVVLMVISICILGESQTIPNLEELKALRSIRGKILGEIVWCTTRHGTWQIYKMKADGTEKVRLTDDQEKNYQPVWSKDGEWIYYQRNDDIWRMRSDGSNSQLVVKGGESFDLSEDGSKLIYVRERQDGYAIFIHDLEKKTEEEIVPARIPLFEGKKVYYPTISPDGQWISFASAYPRPWTIHTVRLDGSGLYEFGFGCMPQYRPDGSLVAWITSVKHKVHIAAPDGESQRPFEDSIPGRSHYYFPRWSNDGEYIVFGASPQADIGASDYEIYIKPFKGGSSVRLTFDPATDIWPDILIKK